MFNLEVWKQRSILQEVQSHRPRGTAGRERLSFRDFYFMNLRSCRSASILSFPCLCWIPQGSAGSTKRRGGSGGRLSVSSVTWRAGLHREYGAWVSLWFHEISAQRWSQHDKDSVSKENFPPSQSQTPPGSNPWGWDHSCLTERHFLPAAIAPSTEEQGDNYKISLKMTWGWGVRL